MNARTLARKAMAMRRKAYAPYSGYPVGAALLTKSGRVFLGCNVENASYGLTVCAERAAIFQAVAAGARAFAEMAVATEDGAAPCGACLQVAREFAPDLSITLVDAAGTSRATRLSELLPAPFTPDGRARRRRSKARR